MFACIVIYNKTYIQIYISGLWCRLSMGLYTHCTTCTHDMLNLWSISNVILTTLTWYHCLCYYLPWYENKATGRLKITQNWKNIHGIWQQKVTSRISLNIPFIHHTSNQMLSVWLWRNLCIYMNSINYSILDFVYFPSLERNVFFVNVVFDVDPLLTLCRSMIVNSSFKSPISMIWTFLQLY